ncbi:MAG: lytic transglycosylase F, partial [Pseudomonadales bacterium]|nr:lytic transglycosylase F [Pseudomonadales bacterium]
LPLLEQKAWYQYTRHGRARGTEPVNYVQNIRQFQDLLEWRFPKSSDQQLPAQMNVKELQQILPASVNKLTPEPQA